MGHAKSIITVDTYTDMQAIIEDCDVEIQEVIREIHPYDSMDAKMLKEMFQGTAKSRRRQQRVKML